MSTLKIEINLDNAAFEDPEELPRILILLAEKIRVGINYEGGLPFWDDNLPHGPWHLQDVNGNTVGKWAITVEDPIDVTVREVVARNTSKVLAIKELRGKHPLSLEAAMNLVVKAWDE